MYNDLRRWKTTETELPQSIKWIKIVGTPWDNPIAVEGKGRNPYTIDSWQNRTDANGIIVAEIASERFFDPKKYYLMPLPIKEILITLELLQNSGR